MRDYIIGTRIYKILILLLFLITVCCMTANGLKADSNTMPQQMTTPDEYRHYVQPIGPPIDLTEVIPQMDQWTCTAQYRDAANNRELIRQLVNGHLITVDQMLNTRNIDIQRVGFGIALQAAMCASEKLEDNTLAFNICDKHLIPNLLSLTEEESWKYMSLDSVESKIVMIWGNGGDTDKVIAGYKSMLEQQPTGNNSDAIRVKLAEALDVQGKYQEAIDYLKQISDSSSVAGAKDMIAELEKKLGAK